MLMLMDGRSRQQSRELGIKLAKGLMEYAEDQARENPEVAQREIVLGAYEYLAKRTEFWRHSPLDESQTEPDERAN